MRSTDRRHGLATRLGTGTPLATAARFEVRVLSQRDRRYRKSRRHLRPPSTPSGVTGTGYHRIVAQTPTGVFGADAHALVQPVGRATAAIKAT